MRLVRFGEPDHEKPGLLDGDGGIRDLSNVIADIDGATLGPQQLDRLRALDPHRLPRAPENTRLAACVGRVPNVICVGLNYRDHAAEANAAIPNQPILFNKHTSCLSGPSDRIICPPGSTKLDWEVELGVVIGRRCWHVSESESLDYVAGYCLANDVSERAYQIEFEGQWTKGKSYLSFGPIGPWLLTADEVSDPQNIALTLDVNGVRRQSGNTRTMIFSVRTLIAYISRFMAFMPGDVLLTGTPAGVALGQKPPRYLSPGDVVALTGAGLGAQRHEVAAYDDDMTQDWRCA